MTVQDVVFRDVWFRYSESTWSNIELSAWQDMGTLEVRDGALSFQGGKYAFEIRDFTNVAMTSQGRDFINTWVRVDYRDGGSPRVAFFNDGSGLGWGGVLGGASRLGAAITEAAGLGSGQQAHAAAGWLPDPTGRHELRYWDGSSWTEHVSDGGAASTDPLGESDSA